MSRVPDRVGNGRGWRRAAKPRLRRDLHSIYRSYQSMRSLHHVGVSLLVASLLAGGVIGSASANDKKFHFDMTRGAKLVASGCLPNATGRVSIKPGGSVEIMDVSVAGLPPNTEFDFFVIQ